VESKTGLQLTRHASSSMRFAFYGRVSTEDRQDPLSGVALR
jgi:hypothetical protein